MAAKKSIAMVFIPIRFSRLIFLLFFTVYFLFFTFCKTWTVHAQSYKEFPTVLKTNLINKTLEKVSSFDENAIFVFKTEKSCLPCYKQMEQYFDNHYPEYNVYIVIIMPEEILRINSEIQHMSQVYKNYEDVYFLFYEQKTNHLVTANKAIGSKEIIKLFDSPSPFFVIKNKDDFEVFDFKRTKEIVDF